MKYRYLKIGGGLIWGEHSITLDHLIAVRQGQYDTIIDTEKNLYYDADENAWKEIQGAE